MTITVGRQKEPMGLTQLASSKDMSLLERTGAVEAFTPNRSNGIVLEGAYNDIFYAAGIFEDEFTGTGTSDYAVTSRVASPVINNGDNLVHLGVSYTSRADSVDGYGLEAAITSGSLHAQAEYLSQDNNGTTLDGYYVEGSWVLTGESIPYSKGVFGRVKPTKASGAWELVARYESGDGDYGDLNLSPDNDNLTDADAVSIGVNWYPTNFIRIGLNYTDGEDNNSNDTGNEWLARLQWAI